ncbi:MAG: hypothetical protein WD021_03890 [Rhodothermales bacterium]
MPERSVWIVRGALVYLCAGVTLGTLLLVDKGLGIGSRIWLYRPLHVEFLFFGWMVQLVFGVASWILPSAPSRQSDLPLLAACAALNVGLWLAGWGAVGGATGVLFVGRVTEAVSVALFAAYVWPRVRAFARA